MKQLPEEQRPYEKCFTQGESALSDSELLAVILRSGTQGKNSLTLAQEILKVMEKSSYPGLTGFYENKWNRTGKRRSAEMHWRAFQKDCKKCCQTSAGYE